MGRTTEGFTPIPRKIQNYDWYTKENASRVLHHLYHNAQFKQSYYKGIKVNEGQIITGRIELAKELKLTESKIRTALDLLDESGAITREPQAQFTLVTLNDWVKRNKTETNVTGKTKSGAPKITLSAEQESYIITKDGPQSLNNYHLSPQFINDILKIFNRVDAGRVTNMVDKIVEKAVDNINKGEDYRFVNLKKVKQTYQFRYIISMLHLKFQDYENRQ